MDSSKNRARWAEWLSGGLWGGTQIAAGVLAGVLLVRLAVVALEPVQSGVWFVLLSFAALVSLMDFGLSATLARELAFVDDTQRRAMLLRTTEYTLRRVAFGAWLLLALVGGWYLHSITPASAWSEILRGWAIFTVGIGFALHANAASSALYGTGHLSTERQIKIFTQLAGVALAYLLLQFEASLSLLCLAWTLQNVLLWGLLWLAFRRKLKLPNASVNPQESIRLLRLGLSWWVMAVGGYLILSTDNFIISSTLGVTQVPDYALLARIATIIQPLALVFVTSSLPLASRLSSTGQADQLLHLLMRQVYLALFLVSFAGAVIAAVPKQIIELWVGPGHFVGYPILIVFLVMLTLEVHHVAHASFVMATGKLPFALWAVGSGLLNIILSLVLVQFFGLFGVALGTMLAQVLTNNWFAVWYSLKYFTVPPRVFQLSVVWPALMNMVILYGVALLIGGLSSLVVSSPLLQIGAVIFGTSLVAAVLFYRRNGRRI